MKRVGEPAIRHTETHTHIPSPTNTRFPSFGGAVLMKMLEEDPSCVQGSAFLCSVPPSGNGPMTSRFLKR